MIQFFKKRYVYHLTIWIASYSILVMIDFFNSGQEVSFIECLGSPFSFFIPVVITSYLGFWAKERFFMKRQYLFYFLAFVAIVFVGVVVYETMAMFDETMGNSRVQNIVNFTFIQVIVVGLQYFKRGIINQYQLQELKAKTAITELNALKAQLNPHFLFNTLNNIYGMNLVNPEKGSEMIMELSDVMRYHLEFSKAGKVRLEDEIQLLRSYIKLEQLRLRETCDVQVDFEDVDDAMLISPLLLIPFVENAFKHGTHPTKESYVHIKIRTTPDKLFFTVKNSLFANRKVVKTNVGLLNTKRRLELTFPDKHQLTINENDTYYLVELSLDL